MTRPPGSFSSPVEAEEGARRTIWELAGVRCVALPAPVALLCRRERAADEREGEGKGKMRNERWGWGSGGPRGAWLQCSAG
jgi:hypothetical protein